jgi:hypothetical protein
MFLADSLYALPLKSKRGEEVRYLFERIFKEVQPEKIQFDEGKLFYNKSFKSRLEIMGIEYFSIHSDKKAALAERFNKTLKTRMWKYLTEKETEVWVNVLHEFVFGYNHSFHSSIGMMPSEAIKEENAE